MRINTLPDNCAYAAMMDSNSDLLRAGAGNLARLGLTVRDPLHLPEKWSMTGGGTNATRGHVLFSATKKGRCRLHGGAKVAAALLASAMASTVTASAPRPRLRLKMLRAGLT